MARIANDGLAEIVAKNSKHFVGWSALLPMNAPEAALQGSPACAQNGANAIQLATNANGAPIDAKHFWPIYEVIEKSGKPILLHPRARARCRTIRPRPTPIRNLQRAGLALRNRRHARAFRLLRHHGCLSELKIISHHLGGVISVSRRARRAQFRPAWRAHVGRGLRRAAQEPEERPYDYFKGFYGDTAVEGARAATICGIDFFTADHVLFASDCPFDKGKGPGYIRDTIKVLNAIGLSETDKEKICHGNAQRLFGLA